MILTKSDFPERLVNHPALDSEELEDVGTGTDML